MSNEVELLLSAPTAVHNSLKVHSNVVAGKVFPQSILASDGP